MHLLTSTASLFLTKGSTVRVVFPVYGQTGSSALNCRLQAEALIQSAESENAGFGWIVGNSYLTGSGEGSLDSPGTRK
jgi:hypothetical protein